MGVWRPVILVEIMGGMMDSLRKERYAPDALCTCEHLFRWHRGGICRIRGCECETFGRLPIQTAQDGGSWLRMRARGG